MKTLVEYLNSKTQKTDIYNYSYKPKTKEELQIIIRKRILKYGSKCDLNDIDVSKITDMSFLFDGDDPTLAAFNGDISEWNTSNVTDMSYMFANTNFNGDISNWDVSNVKYMYSMFDNCKLKSHPPKWYKRL